MSGPADPRADARHAGSAAARRIEPLEGPLDADVRLPGSKSITNRALVCAALAAGESRLDGALFADDTEAMLGILAALGVGIVADRDAATITVAGTGGRLPDGPVTLDARLSGTTSRFIAPVLALGIGPYLLDGAAPLRARPMGDGFDALRSLGASIDEVDGPGHLPAMIAGSAEPAGTMPVSEVRLRADVSSQFASGLLLSAPARPGGLTIHLDGPVVSRPYLDMTVAVMAAFGATVSRPDDVTYVVAGGGYQPREYRIEPDASAASYFFAAPAIAGGSVRVHGTPRSGRGLQGDWRFVDVLEQMGAVITRRDTIVEVRVSPPLRGIEADFTDISDTAQTLASVAVFADAPTTITGIGFIRRKETDRIAAMLTELRRCGIDAEELEDGLRIVPGVPRPAVIRTYDDHRMAMSFALLGLRAPGIEIADPAVVDKTFPTFWEVFGSLRSGGNAGRA